MSAQPRVDAALKEFRICLGLCASDSTEDQRRARRQLGEVLYEALKKNDFAKPTDAQCDYVEV
jgi:hypothetical protein